MTLSHLQAAVEGLHPSVRRALAEARRCYHALPAGQRPPLDQPNNCNGLFPRPEDMVALAKAGLWPLPRRLRAWLAESPQDRARRRRRRMKQIASVVRDVLVRELPDAINYQLERGAE